MGRYLSLWEIDESKIPVDPKERGGGWSLFMAMVKESLEKGVTKDWGAFVGETSGYSILEGTEVEVGSYLQKFVPFVSFKLFPIASVSQVEEVIKSLSG